MKVLSSKTQAQREQLISFPDAASTPEQRNRHMKEVARILILVAFLAAATSILYFSHFRDFYSTDTPDYVTPAANLIAGKGFLDAHGNPDTLRTPGYPLLIAPFIWGHLDLKYLVLLQHLLRVGLVVAASYASFLLSGSRGQALLSGIVLCIDLPFLRSANSLLTETFFTVVLGAALIFLWRASKETARWPVLCVAAGLLAGFMVLIRPVALYFFIPAAAFFLLTRRTYRLVAASVLVLSFIAIPGLWAFRNYQQTGYFTVSSISGFSVLYCRAAGVLAINDAGEFYANLDKRSEQLKQESCHAWERLHGEDCSHRGIPEISRFNIEYGKKIVVQHPLAYLKLAARGVGMAMFTGSPASLSGMTGMNFNTAARVLLIYTVPAFGFALLGLWMFWHFDRSFFWLAALVCIYFIGISAGAETFARFRVPIMPIYVILIAMGIESALHRVSAWRYPNKNRNCASL